MSDAIYCGECGAPLPDYWPKGLCARCALDGLLDLPEAETRMPSVDDPPFSPGKQPSLAGSPPNLTGGRFADYELLEEIARGGMGVVYRARQVSLNRTVALKMILSGQFASKQEVLRFRAEAEAAANLRHPNIVAIYEIGESEGRHFFSMDYVRGRNLAEIARDGPLTAKRTAQYASIVAEAIHYAHEQGVLHRDLKPSNILIDENDNPRITDFGLAKIGRGDLGLTATGELLGSPNFMPPEQTSGKSGKAGPPSDVYGLGAIVYHLLTARPPFQGETIEDLLRQLHEAEPVAPHLLNPGIPRDLETICLKCLEKEPAKRYQSARELADELGRFMRNEPIQARPLNAPEKIWRWCRRKPVVAALMALVGIAFLAGMLGTSIGLLRAKEARRLTATKNDELEAKKEELETNLYFNLVALAHRESTAEPSNVKEAERLLDECLPRFRNWEWHYLRRRRYSEPLVLADPESKRTYSVSFSLDGRYLASGGDGGKLKIWDLDGAKVVQTLTGHTGFVASVAFSPRNPAWVASAGSDRQLVLWDWTTGEKIHSWTSGKSLGNGMAYSVAFSPDGQRLAASADNGEVIVCDTATGGVLFRLTGHEQVAQCVSFSADGRWIATGSSQGIVSLWDAPSGKLVKSIAPPGPGPLGPPVIGVAFSRDGQYLAAADVACLVRVWDTGNHREISSFRVGNAILSALAFHPNSGRVITGGTERLVTVSDPFARREVLVFRELARGCSCLALGPGGHRLAAASRDGRVHVWDATPVKGTELHSLNTLDYPGQLWALAITKNGRSIAVAGLQPLDSSAGQGAEVLVWSSPGFTKPVRLPGYSIVVFSLDYDSTGRLLALSGDERGTNRLKVLDLESGQEAYPVAAFAGEEMLFSVAFSPDGRWLVGGGRDRKIKVWDGANGKEVGVVGEHDDQITKLAFSPDGRYLASIGDDDIVKVWDATRLDKAQVPYRLFDGQCDDYADSIAFSPEGSRLGIITGDDEAKIYNIDGDDSYVPLIGRGHRPLALAFSPDGAWVASGGRDCAVKVWDAQTGDLLHTFKGHIDQVTRLRFFQRSEGLCLASGSRDKTVNLWDLTSIR